MKFFDGEFCGRKRLKPDLRCFGGGGGGSSVSQGARNVAPSIAAGGGLTGGTPGIIIAGASNAGDVSAQTGANGGGQGIRQGKNSGGVGTITTETASQQNPVAGSPSVTASGILSTAVQISTTTKTNAPVVNISSGYGSSISAPQDLGAVATDSGSSMTWLNWLEIGAFAMFGFWLFRRQ